MRRKVVVTDRPLPHIEEERRIVEEAGGRLEVHDARTQGELREIVGGAYVILANLARLDRAMIEGLEGTRGIVRYGVGYDSVDVEAATERGIYVANVPGFCTLDVAEHTVGLLLSLTRKIPQLDRYVREGGYSDTSGYRLYRPMPRLAGKRAGVIGFGSIGREVAARLLALGVSVAVYDPYLKMEAMGHLAGEVKMVDLEALLKQSDVITIHAPLTAETRDMIGERELAMMKPTALLLNVSRGGIVVEEDLAGAVRDGTIAGAAVDTLSAEPPAPDHPLLGIPGILVTPHLAWYSEESVMDLERGAAEQAAQILGGGGPTNLVNRSLL